MNEYYIESGVHRAIAFRENGILLIPAMLFMPGSSPRQIWVRLEQLHSYRVTVSRSDPRHAYPQLEQALGTAPGRMRVPMIHLQPLGLPGQPPTIPLDQVVIVA